MLALEPIVECRGDPSAYGFRPSRSPQDAIEQLVVCLSRRCSGQWVLEGDRKACFEEIGHQWLREHVPMDREVLEQTVKPAIQKFLAQRGLRLSEEKTVITHIRAGFDF